MTETTTAADVPPRLTDYETARATFRIDVPERFNAVIDIVERWAAEAPADMALVSLDGRGDVVAEQTVADLARESSRCGEERRPLIEQGEHCVLARDVERLSPSRAIARHERRSRLEF